jgi:hypothetical protein
MRAPSTVLASALVLAACGGTPSSTRPAAQPSGTAAERTATRTTRATEVTNDTARDDAAQVRALGNAADFGALVRAAQALEAAGAAGSDAGCVLRAPTAPGASWRLEADVAVALRPLPAAWEDLDAPLRTRRGAARLLSRWGQTRTEPFAIALAVPLDPDVRLPAEPVVPPEVMDRGFCGGGALPEPAADAVEGDLPAVEVRAALAPLGEAAARCLAGASGRAASGGRLDLALRITAAGRVGDACVVRDPILDPTLRLCVLAAAQSLRFPAPSPAGFVDLALPLRLTPDAALAQRPLCE